MANLIQHWMSSLLQDGVGSIPHSSWMSKSHNADYEYGTGGGHAKPCRACSDFQTWVQTKNSSTKTSQQPSSHSQNAGNEKGCPLDKDELGRNTWSLLHSMAAYYPEKASIQQQTLMTSFIEGLASFYPCESCASDFRRDIKQEPPNTAGRVELSNWWCRMHNRVNRKLGKPEFNCKQIDERWLEGWKDGSCN